MFIHVKYSYIHKGFGTNLDAARGAEVAFAGRDALGAREGAHGSNGAHVAEARAARAPRRARGTLQSEEECQLPHRSRSE